MKLPQRILQMGTLALFSSMIGSLVLYRGGVFESKPSQQQDLAKVWQDSLQPPWFDSAQFNQVLRETVQERLATIDFRMFGSKSAPPAPPPPRKKNKGKNKSTEQTDAVNSNAATRWDSLIAMDILRTRYELGHLSNQEATEYQAVYASLLLAKDGDWNKVDFSSNPYAGGWDSSFALAILKYGPQHLPRLSAKESARFQIVLDSLMQPRWMSSKSGLIFTSAFDTMDAIKIVKEEKRSQ